MPPAGKGDHGAKQRNSHHHCARKPPLFSAGLTKEYRAITERSDVIPPPTHYHHCTTITSILKIDNIGMTKGTKNTIIYRRYGSPCGELLLGSLGENLCLCNWTAGSKRSRDDRRLERLLCARFEEGTSQVIEQAARQLDEYFAGTRREFSVPLLFAGSEFQKTVWNALTTIPFGTTVSYAGLASRLGSPTAVRAVANANGANAISIFAPCHRVIGADGTLTGYGGGLAAKRALLELEGATFKS